ncbi:MAG: hypothetical protein R6T78_04575 [Dehalococcoidales bacterium]
MRLTINLSEMTAMVRKELKDEAGELWSDEELTWHITRTVKDFSAELPLESRGNIATTSGSREVDISGMDDIVMLRAVEYPVGDSPASYVRFSLWGDTLTILGDRVPDGSDCRVYYGKLHTLDVVECTVPGRCHELIAAGAAGYAAVSWAVYSINRVNVGGKDISASYLGWGGERLEFFRKETKRVGRTNRVRTGQLYVPGHTPVSGTTDYGP